MVENIDGVVEVIEESTEKFDAKDMLVLGGAAVAGAIVVEGARILYKKAKPMFVKAWKAHKDNREPVLDGYVEPVKEETDNAEK